MTQIALLEPCAPFNDLLVRRVRQSPDRIMLVDELDRELTFAELQHHATSLAAELVEWGVTPGTRVAWQLPTWQESVALIAGLSMIDAVQIPIPHIYRRHEVHAGLLQTAADVLITPTEWGGFDFEAMARSIAADLPLRCFTTHQGAIQTGSLLTRVVDSATGSEQPDRVPLAGDDVRWIFFTSGTSSAPKGVQHTDLSAGLPSLAMAKGLALQPSDRSAVAFPIGHIGGLNWTIAALLSGCQLLLAERFAPSVIDYFDRRGITLPGVVTAQHLAYRDAARARTEPLFVNTRAYPGGGATKPPTLLGELREVIGGVIVSGYGMTEHPMITMGSIEDPIDRLSSTEGRPSPGVQVSIRADDGMTVCPTGTSGEIWVKGPHMFRGYLDAPATAAVMDRDGFLRTGDLGVQDAEGFLTITGRAKDVIVRKGENISAKEVEDLLYTHPDIADVTVVGLADPRLGERCCAVIVARAGAAVPTVGELGEFLGARGLMAQKWPEQVEVVTSLARNAAGKVLKADIIRALSET